VEVAITLRGGDTHVRQQGVPRGSPGDALSDEEHSARFEDGIRYSAIPLPPQPVAAFRTPVLDLERLPDARTLVTALIEPDRPVHDGHRPSC
jgi:hypothetical protein